MLRIRRLLVLFGASIAMSLAGCGGSSESSSLQSSLQNSGAGVQATDGEQEQAAGTGVPFTILGALPSPSSIIERRVAVVRDADSWDKLWKEHERSSSPARPVPAVDFSQRMVIAVFLGAQSPCNAFVLESVREHGQAGRLEVSYRVIPPPENTPCIAIAYFPAFFISVPQSALPVTVTALPAHPASALVIRSGWRFGFCLGSCEGEMRITSDGALYRAAIGGDSQGIWSGITREEWESLAAVAGTLINTTLGCPDCLDEGLEWIEVQHEGQKMRLNMSCGVPLSGAAVQANEFVSRVRTVRARLANALGRPDPCATKRAS